MSTATQVTPATADEKWGFPFGVDGVLGLEDACAFLGGISRFTLDRRANEGLLRKGKHENSNLVIYCRRSLVNYLSTREL